MIMTITSSILDALSPESDQLEEREDREIASGSADLPPRESSVISVTKVPRYPQYRHALEPLKELEERLIRMLSSPDEDEPTHTTPPKPDWSLYANGTFNQVPIGKNGRPAPSITIPPSRTSPSPLSPLSPSTSLPSPGG